MTELGILLLTALLILSLLTALLLIAVVIVLYFIWKRLSALNDTQDVIFNSCVATEEYFEAIAISEGVTASQN
tara:strand:- start:1308 stop:1526 length:219 start_codon:yes stop_codon:yes gene_type:complete